MKKLAGVVLGMGILMGSTISMAEPVADQMKVMATHYQDALKADNAAVFKKELMSMREAAVKSKEDKPVKLKDSATDSEAMKDYRLGMDKLIAEIDQAVVLADAGKMNEAKKAAEDFKLTRNEYHKKYR